MSLSLLSTWWVLDHLRGGLLFSDIQKIRLGRNTLSLAAFVSTVSCPVKACLGFGRSADAPLELWERNFRGRAVPHPPGAASKGVESGNELLTINYGN